MNNGHLRDEVSVVDRNTNTYLYRQPENKDTSVTTHLQHVFAHVTVVSHIEDMPIK